MILGPQIVPLPRACPGLTLSSAGKLAEHILDAPHIKTLPTNTKGAFFSRSPHPEFLFMVEDRAVEEKARDRFAEHGKLHACWMILDRETRLAEDIFVSETDLLGANIEDESVRARLDVWLLTGNAWCLAHIFAGIRLEGAIDETALRNFERQFARSSHDRLAARIHLDDSTRGAQQAKT